LTTNHENEDFLLDSTCNPETKVESHPSTNLQKLRGGSQHFPRRGPPVLGNPHQLSKDCVMNKLGSSWNRLPGEKIFLRPPSIYLRNLEPRKKSLNWLNWRWERLSKKKIVSSESLRLLPGPFPEKRNKFQSLAAPHSWVKIPWPWPPFGLRCVVAVHVNKTKQKKSKLSQDPPP